MLDMVGDWCVRIPGQGERGSGMKPNTIPDDPERDSGIKVNMDSGTKLNSLAEPRNGVHHHPGI